MIKNEQLEQAIELLRQDPLPQDAVSRLDALTKAAPSNEQPYCDDLFEALATVSRMRPSTARGG